MNAETYMRDWIAKDKPANLERPKHRHRFATIASLLPLGLGLYADVGCACGHSTEALRALVPGRWIGIDFSESAIAAAVGSFPYCDWRLLTSLAELGRDDGPRPEGVVCSEVLEHVDDDAGLVAELVATTGHTLVLTTPCIPVDDPGHLRLYTREALEALFEPHGPAHIRRDKWFWYVTWRSRSGNKS